MGRIFSTHEVFEHLVPQPEHFQPAAQDLLHILKQAPEEAETPAIRTALNAFDGALIFGSTIKGSANQRSDLDIVIAYDVSVAETDEILSGFSEIFSKIYSQWNVPVESTKHPTTHLQSGRHSLDPMVMQHLDSVSDDWIAGDNPLSFTRNWNLDWLTIFDNYATAKRKKFDGALSDPPHELDRHTLQRAYELPSALGRKSLGVFVKLGLIEDEEFHGAPKGTVVNRLRELTPATVTTPMEVLLEADAEYNLWLRDGLKGLLTLTEYTRAVEDMYQPALAAAVRFSSRLNEFVLDRAISSGRA